MEIDEYDAAPSQSPAETAGSQASSECPSSIPEKFWDPDKGVVRTDALLRSYVELERKLGRALPLPEGPEDLEGRNRLLSALGWPASPDGYEIALRSEVVTSDPELNARLHAAGFTQNQVQLVYDLAAEHIAPLVEKLAADAEWARHEERLAEHFGGTARWRETARQIRTWAEAHLEPNVYSALATSYQGVLALHRMMRADEPPLVAPPDRGAERPDEKALGQMVRDPRYWRDRDPEFIARVTEGFRQLYAE